MNLEQLQSDWQSHNAKLDECIHVNTRLLNQVQAIKQSNELDALVTSRIIEAALFFVIVLLLWQYIADSWALTAPVVSAFILNVFAIIGLAGNIGQIVFLKQINYGAPIKTTLLQLIKIRSHNLNLFKLLLLSVPFYMAYVFLGYELLFNVDLFMLMTASTKLIFGGVAIALLVMTMIFITKLKPENRNQSIINWVFENVTGERLTKLLKNAEGMTEQ